MDDWFDVLVIVLATFLNVIWGSIFLHTKLRVLERCETRFCLPIKPVVSWPFLRFLDRRRQQALAEQQISSCIVLFSIALESGANILGAVQAVGRYLQEPVGSELRTVARHIENGGRMQDALQEFGKKMPVFREFVSTLIATERYGASVSMILERLAVQSRESQEQRVERAAKRLSIRLLFPLAGFTLPAFVLLTLIPVFAEALALLNQSSR